MASSETRVCDLRFSEPTIASTDESAGTAWDRMVSKDVDHLVVLQEGRIVGMLSRADLSGPRGGTHRRMGRRVGELMHSDVVTATSRTSVRRAAALMCRRKTDCLLIVDRQRPTGLVTVWQVLDWLVRDAKPA
ncbi:MAG TPA: CBS domain-containing protein [Polyangiaceae bacterium]|nr:CBS domain-containing protein [Polyangiaceae bacterium]